jgi:acetyl esterase/lipase
MSMAKRPEVKTSRLPIAAIDVFGLSQHITTSLLHIPFRRVLSGGGSMTDRASAAVVREISRAFIGYTTGLPIDQFRSVELVIDEICRGTLGVSTRLHQVSFEQRTYGGVPGLFVSPKGSAARGRIIYLHGGGHIGSTPTMYAYFTSAIAHATRCEVFVADYRLAPEFPYPADLEDALNVLEATLSGEVEHSRLFIAGDSGGAGTACSLIHEAHDRGLPSLGGLILISPEADLSFEHASVRDNADLDILPWNIPTTPFLHGVNPKSGLVSAIDQDVHDWPATYVAFGSDEIFRDSIRVLIEHLDEAGVVTDPHEYAGMFHVFPILMPWAKASRDVQNGIGRFVTRILDVIPQFDSSIEL